MTTNDDDLSAEARRAHTALEALRDSPPAAAAFRERLKRDFVSGAIDQAAREGGGGRVVAMPRRRLAPAWRWGLTAAAAAVAACIGIVLNTGPAWQLVLASGSGVAMLNGRPMALGNSSALSSALLPGTRVIVPAGAQVEIASAGTMAIQMTGGTDAVLPAPPGRWFARAVRGTIHVGEWRVTTGPAFAGSRLDIVTPNTRVEVTGTTLAVICEPQGTCVCVFEGHVKVGRDAGGMAVVEKGRRRYTYADSTRSPLDDAMLPHEVPALGGFCTSMRTALQAPR